MDNEEMCNDEIMAISAIYGDEWIIDNSSTLSFSLKLFSGNDTNFKNPLVVQFKLPEKYPLEEKPIFTISAPWMSREDKLKLNNEIDSLCQENLGQSVLYMIIEKIKQFLNDEILFEPENKDNEIQYDQQEKTNERFIQVYHGDPITDRKSTFQAHMAEVFTLEDVKFVLNKLKENNKIADATHNIYAYRIICDEHLNKFDQDYDDDGESHAGSRLLQLLENTDVRNVLMVVSRWFGGTLLGADRFKHIQNVAKELLIKHHKIHCKK